METRQLAGDKREGKKVEKAHVSESLTFVFFSTCNIEESIIYHLIHIHSLILPSTFAILCSSYLTSCLGRLSSVHHHTSHRKTLTTTTTSPPSPLSNPLSTPVRPHRTSPMPYLSNSSFQPAQPTAYPANPANLPISAVPADRQHLNSTGDGRSELLPSAHPEKRVLIIATGGTICMKESPEGLVPARGFLEDAMKPRPSFNDGSKCGE